MKTLLIHVKIHQHEEDALLIIDNKIAKIGFLCDFNQDEMDEIIDCEGRRILPGFNDSHLHLIGTGAFVASIQLQDCKSVNDVLQKVKDKLHTKAKGEWIIGRGWNQDNFDETVYPTKQMLDEITVDHPILLTRCCGHIAVANSKAIELAKVTKDTKIDGGDFDLDSGLFKEMAIEAIHHAYPETTIQDLKEYIQVATKECHRYGITSVQSDDFVTLTKDYHLPLLAYLELEQEGQLQLRVNQQCQFIERKDFEQFIQEDQLKHKDKEFFRLGPIKVVGDGSLGARTAKMSKPYHDDSQTTGMTNYTQEDFDYFVKMGMDYKMGTIIHTIGDGCLDMVLSSFDKYHDENNSNRSGLVHVQITRLEQLDKIRKYHLHAYIQSCFIDYDSRIVRDRVGDVANTSYAFKTLYHSTTISNGSDSPVEPANCFNGIECAIRRSSIGRNNIYRPEEALTLQEAIDSYTKDGAYASFEENIKGQLKEGMLADIIVLDKDPYEIEVSDLHTIQVIRTIFNGKTVYSSL